MNIALADQTEIRSNLFPFSLTRPVADLRIGLLTIREKWEKRMGQSLDFLTTDVLAPKYSPNPKTYHLVINAGVCPDEDLLNAISTLADNSLLYHGDDWIAIKSSITSLEDIDKQTNYVRVEYKGNLTIIKEKWNLFTHNEEQIKADFELVTQNRKSVEIVDPYTKVYNPEAVFLEQGVSLKSCVINAENGPVYLGKNTTIEEGAIIRGPFALCENSRINMAATIRENTTIGPNCKVGGEVSNAIFFGNSNKGHAGFLGNSVIGEWCNLGADTNNSNLKNNYDEVKIWDEGKSKWVNTGLQFCGLFMGDHSKTAINSMFNTGTVAGVACNVLGSGFPNKYLPSFTWGGIGDYVTHEFEKAMLTAKRVMERRNRNLSDEDIAILRSIFELYSKDRI